MDTASEAQVREQVAAVLRAAPTDTEWRILAVQSLLALDGGSGVVRTIVQLIEHHRAQDWGEPEPIQRAWKPGSGQWDLMVDLHEAEEEVSGKTPTGRNVISLTLKPWFLSRQSATTVQPRISIEFDHRLSQRELVAQIRAHWPGLRECGWVRQTRALKPKAVALVRHVCLETAPGTSWAESKRKWNTAKRTSWRYAETRLFQRDFRRAEEQLTGDRYGLERFYNPVASFDRTELGERCAAGEKEALDYVERDLKRTRDRQERNKTMADCTALEELR